MPKASKVSEEEKQVIVKTAYALKHKNPKIGPNEIARQVNRSPQVVTKILSDKKYERFKNAWKKKIDLQRFETIQEADIRVLNAIKSNKMKPYQLIGASKVYYEQSFGLQEEQNRVPQAQVNLQIVEGDVAYNPKSESNEAS